MIDEHKKELARQLNTIQKQINEESESRLKFQEQLQSTLDRINNN